MFFPVGACSVSDAPGSILGCLLGGSWLHPCCYLLSRFEFWRSRVFLLLGLFCRLLLRWCIPLFHTLFFLLCILSILPACGSWLFRWVGCCWVFFLVFLPALFYFRHRWFLCRAALFLNSASLWVDVGVISLLFIMLSSVWLSLFFSFLVGFLVSLSIGDDWYRAGGDQLPYSFHCLCPWNGGPCYRQYCLVCCF